MSEERNTTGNLTTLNRTSHDVTQNGECGNDVNARRERIKDPIVQILYEDIWTDDVTKIHEGFVKLRNILYNNIHNIDDTKFDTELFVTLGALNHIVVRMEKMIDDEVVQVVLSDFMLLISKKFEVDSKPFKLIINRLKYFDILFSSMQKHLNLKTVQENSIMQLVNFASKSIEFHRYFRNNNITIQNSIFNATKQYPDNFIIQSFACKFFMRMKATPFTEFVGLIELKNDEIREMINAALLVQFINGNDENISVYDDFRFEGYDMLQLFYE